LGHDHAAAPARFTGLTRAHVVPSVQETRGGAMTLLSLERVGKVFGGLQALHNVSFDVKRGEIFGLIGPNGAGKSTLFNVVTGVYRPDAGKVVFDGETISVLRPAQIAARGIGRTFQNIRLFKSMTVEQNVMAASPAKGTAGLWGAVWR